jgi:hypothetical protein
MTYGSIIKTSATNGSEIITKIKAELASSGWTTSDSTTYTSPNASPALQVTFSSTSLATNGVIQIDVGVSGNKVTCYALSGNSTLTSSYVGLEWSISNTHFYINIIGPNKSTTGRVDATYGSVKSFTMLTTYTPYFTSNSTTSRQWAAISSFWSAPGTPSISTLPAATAKIYYPNPSTGTLETGELITMRSAVQDQSVVGDLINNKTAGGSEIYWPYVISSDVIGVVGRLNNVFFGGDNYTLAGDSSAQLHNRSSVIIGGNRYARQLPAFWPNSSSLQWYTPFGTCEVTTNKECGIPGSSDAIIDITTGTASVGGPNIVVKRGDGS